MADKNWNEKLRNKMSEFTQTPPEGLWEAIEASGAVGSGAPAAGAAAGSGLLARLFGRRTAPVWLSLAGVAAGLALFFVLRTPSPGQSIIAGDDATLAAVENTVEAETSDAPAEDVTEQGMDVLQSGGDAPEAGVSQAVNTKSSRAQKAPVLRAEVVPSTQTEPEDVVAAATEDNSIINPESQDSGAAEVTPEADESNLVPSGNDGEDTVNDVPATKAPVVQPGSNVLPLTKSVKRTRPLLAASLIGGGMPGSSASTSETVYGLSSGPKMASAGNRAMALVSRNKATEVLTSHRIDYQFGLLVTYNFTNSLGIESGLQYTRLGSTKTSTSGSLSTVTEENFDYIGLPLRLVYTPLKLLFLQGYVSAGPELEYGISHIWRSFDNLSRSSSDMVSGTDTPGDFFISGSLNAGLQITPWKSGAFFIQPGLVYRFYNTGSPVSYYTEHALSFRLSAGYRIMF